MKLRKIIRDILWN